MTMPNYNLLFRRTVAVYVLTALILPLTIIIRAIYARNLSIVDYGLFYSLLSFFTALGFLRNWGVGISVLYFANKYLALRDNSKIKSLFTVYLLFQLIASIILIGILIVLAGPIESLIYHNEGSVAYMFHFFMLYWILEPFLFTYTDIFVVYNEQHIAKGLELGKWLLIMALSLLSFHLFESYKVPILAYIIADVLAILVVTVIAVRRHAELVHAPLYKGKDIVQEVFTYSRQAVTWVFFSLILTSLDVFIVQLLLGAESVAYYSSGVSTANLLLLLVTSLSLISQPLFARLWHEKKMNELSRLVNLLVNNLLMLVVPFSLFLFAFADQVITVMYGSRFLPSAIIVKIFCLGLILKMFNTFFFHILLGIGRPSESSRIMVWGLMVNLVLGVLGVLFFGTVGVALATCLSYLCVFVLCIFELKKALSLSFDLLGLGKVLASGCIFLVVSVLLLRRWAVAGAAGSNIVLIVSAGTIFVICLSAYVFLLYISGVITKQKLPL